MSEPSLESSPADLTSRMQFHPGLFLRGCVILIAVKLGALFLGGTGVFMIVLGLWVALKFPLVFWPQTHKIASGLFGISSSATIQSSSSSTSRTLTRIYQLLFFAIYLGFGLSLIYMGGRIIWEDGFLNQNLIYNLFFRP